MSEQRTSGSGSSRSSGSASSAGGSSAARSPLQTERGNTVIQDGVVSKIAGIAAQEVDGIRMGSGGTTQAVGNFLGSITGGGGSNSPSQGVSVEVGQEEAAMDLTCTAEYGKSIPQLTEAVRRNVANRVESLVGLRVTEVNITVSDVYFPQEEAQQQRQQQQQQIEQQQQQRVQ